MKLEELKSGTIVIHRKSGREYKIAHLGKLKFKWGNISRWVNSVTYVGPDKVTGLPENFTRTFTDFQQSFLIQKEHITNK